MLRLREDGLGRLSKNDIYFGQSENNMRILHRLCETIAAMYPARANVLNEYSASDAFNDNAAYRRVLARLPAPPLEQSLAYDNPAALAQ